MLALITGSDGFVGPYLNNHLKEAGDKVIGLDRNNGPDLLETEKWVDEFKKHQPEVVYHLAGWSNIASSWQDPITSFDTNTKGTLSILNAAKVCDVKKVLVVSSADVYKNNSETLLTETHETLPQSPYGASKICSEVLAQQFFQGYGLQTIVARPFNHIGVGQRTEFVASKFAKEIAQIEKNGAGKLTHGNLDAVRDFTNVKDVVAAYRLLVAEGRPGEIYNVCSGTGTKIKSLLDILLDQSNSSIETIEDSTLYRPSDCPSRIGNPNKLISQTGWSSHHQLEETLFEILEHERKALT